VGDPEEPSSPTDGRLSRSPGRSPASTDVPNARTALIVDCDTRPATVVRVDLATGRSAHPVAIGSDVPTPGDCGEGYPGVVAFNLAGTTAFVPDCFDRDIVSVDLATGAAGPDVAVHGLVGAILVPGGWPDVATG
jgi:hypothetical protein